MSAIFKNSKAITTMVTSSGKSVAVFYVSETTGWRRSFLDQSAQNEFVQVAEKYKDTSKPETTQAAIKEAEHPSQADAAPHCSAVELDQDNKVIASKHYYK